MESNNTNYVSSSFCKICSENGFPNVLIYWKRVKMEDGSTQWKPCEDLECSVKHTHRKIESRPSTEANISEGDANTVRNTPQIDQHESLSESEIGQALLDVYHLSQQQNQLLKGLLDTLGYPT